MFLGKAGVVPQTDWQTDGQVDRDRQTVRRTTFYHVTHVIYTQLYTLIRLSASCPVN